MQSNFEETFLKYSKDIYKLAYSYVLNKSDAEDIVQKTFYKYLKNIKKAPTSNEEIKKWLFRISVNESKDLLRNFKFKSKNEISDLPSTVNYDDNLLVVLKKVSKNNRIPLYLYYYEGYSIKEISIIMKLSSSAVKMRLNRGKEQIKKELER